MLIVMGSRGPISNEAKAKARARAKEAKPPTMPAVVRARKPAAKIWRDTVRELQAAGMDVCRLDVSALTRWCLYNVAWLEIHEDGIAVVGVNGNGAPDVSAHLKASLKISTELDRLAAELGLTPKARLRMTKAETAKSKGNGSNPWDKFAAPSNVTPISKARSK